MASKLDLVKVEAASEKKCRASANLKDIEAKIERYQTRLNAIIKEREEEELEEGLGKI